MYYLVYKITNLINSKVYVGVHKTTDINDSYMGSGQLVKAAILKYGLDNFKKEILFDFKTEKEMFKKEAEIVNLAFIERKDTYNLNVGGYGGFTYMNSPEMVEKRRALFTKNLKLGSVPANKRRLYLLKNDKEWREKYTTQISNTLKEHFKNNPAHFKDQNHSEESKRKIGEANKISQKGKRNSQFGTMWIFNLELEKNMKIKKEELSSMRKEGWEKGRKSFKKVAA